MKIRIFNFAIILSSVIFLTSCLQEKTEKSFVCDSGNCIPVPLGGPFASLQECQSACSNPSNPGGTSAGFNCVNGNCASVSSGASYSTLSQCQSACSASSVKPTGSFKITVNRPTGSCQSSPTWGRQNAFSGWIYAVKYDQNGNTVYQILTHPTQNPWNPSYGSTNNSWTYTSNTGVSRLIWELYPSASSWPTSCNREGELWIDYQGQQKTVVIW
jgi:hypothetical protein